MFKAILKSALLIILPLFVACGGGGDDVIGDFTDGGSGGTNENQSCPPDAAMQQEMTQLINAARANARHCGSDYFEAVGPVSWSDQLYQAAYNHSQDMSSHNFFNHVGSDGSTAGDRIAKTGYVNRAWGENIAAGFSSATATVNGWLDSPSHCASIMQPSFTELGAACGKNGASDYGTYWTLVLASSK